MRKLIWKYKAAKELSNRTLHDFWWCYNYVEELYYHMSEWEPRDAVIEDLGYWSN